MRWLREKSSRGWGWMVGTVLGLSVLAADGPDQVAFNAALRSFSIGAYARAADEFTAFSSQFPDSALKPEALRRALYAQGRPRRVVGIMPRRRKPSGSIWPSSLDPN